jgi:hypothetical protein
LTNSFNKNMTTTAILTGDMDFRPVVESVVRLGTYVILAYAPYNCSKELARAADTETIITIETLCSWMAVDSSQRSFHFPNSSRHRTDGSDPFLNVTPTPALIGTAEVGPQRLQLRHHKIGNDFYAHVRHEGNSFHIMQFNDEAKLLAYVQAFYGEMKWHEK